MTNKIRNKVKCIQKHVSGKPYENNEIITWIEFMADAKFADETEMNQAAIGLLTGEFYFIDGHTYFLNKMIVE